jgi:hypothetical protein
MIDDETFERIRQQWRIVRLRDKRTQRLWAAAEAAKIPGGITWVARATGLTRDAIRAGRDELKPRNGQAPLDGEHSGEGDGVGRKSLMVDDPGLVGALESLIEPLAGAWNSPLRWTLRSTRELAELLSRQKRCMSDGTEKTRNIDGRTVAKLLHLAGYYLRANRRRIEGSELPDRDRQFQHLNKRVKGFLRQQQPVIAVDTGVWVAIGRSRDADLIGVIPGQLLLDPNVPLSTLRELVRIGCADAIDSRRWTSVGIAEDAVRLVAAAIRQWWDELGEAQHPDARKLLIAADCGGRDNRRTRNWKLALQELADQIKLPLTVCHLPRGVSKWTNVVQQFVSFGRSSEQNLQAVNKVAVVSAIERRRSNTPARRVALDDGDLRVIAEVVDEVFNALKIAPESFNGDWNFAVTPTEVRRR